MEMAADFYGLANLFSQRKIIFTGYIDRLDKPYLYNLADLFVYFSFYEGFGLPPLEAMACGCPVIVSANSSLPEVAGGGAVMVDADNSGQIAKVIAEVLTDEQWRSDLAYFGRRLAGQFSWQKAAQEYSEFFSSL